MLAYIFAIAVVNFSLGFVFAAWRDRRGARAPIVKPAEAPPHEHAEPTETPPAPDAELPAETVAQPPTPSALDEAFAPVWGLDILEYRRQLIGLQESAGSCRDASALTYLLEEFESIAGDWWSAATPACERLQERRADLGNCQPWADRLVKLLTQASNQRKPAAKFAAGEPAGEALAAACRGIVDETYRLLDEVQTLRDVRQEAEWAVAQEENSLADLPENRLSDPHSRLHNRLGLEVARRQWRTGHGSEPWSIAVLDIDGFGKLNRKWGAGIGDRVLAAFAGLADDLLRKDRAFDRAGRGAGDQFVLFLGGSDSDASINAAERIRQTIDASSIAIGKQQIELTVSMGVVTGSDADSLEDVLNRATQAVSAARDAGGNCTFRFGKDGPASEPARPFQVKGRIVKIDETARPATA